MLTSFTVVAVALLAAPAAPKLPLTGLGAAVHVPDLCKYHYRVSTPSAECQKFCDEAFGYYYSYVWMEAARSFETALQHDPDCALAWLGLHRSLEKWGKTKTPKPDAALAITGGSLQPKLPDRFTKAPHDYALEQAKRLMAKASHRESLLITAKLQERGMWPDVKPEERRKKATQTLDELLSIYEDDEEGWFWRAQIAEGQHGPIPFYKALLKLNPLHPGANHELVHVFENIRRPALGWPYAEGYIASSPGVPHAFHMQAHLAMRVGKWQKTTDWSWRAVELQKAYHALLKVKPEDDHQFRHHMETLTRSLVHDGRFVEAASLRKEAEGYKYHFRPEWFRHAVAEKNWADAEKVVSDLSKTDKPTRAYFTAVLFLERGMPERARAEIDVLKQGNQSKRNDRLRDLRLWEVQGRYECQTGNGEAGVKLLRRTIDKTKDDYAHHAWGGGAYYMEVWGTAALEAGIASEAEEAFQEALAHDAGSVRGALGLWALCDRLGRTEEADRYLKVAHRCWAKAESGAFAVLKDDFAKKAANVPTPSVATK
jgi:tetratricopeptide (TPR) repeat protein